MWWLPYALGAPVLSLLSWGMFLCFRYRLSQLALARAKRGDVRMKVGPRVTEVICVRADRATVKSETPRQGRPNVRGLDSQRKDEPPELPRSGAG